jgi:hypothetical protein
MNHEFICFSFAVAMQKVLSKVLSFLKNKYYLSLIAFFTWVIFFDSNNFFEIWKYRKNYMQLRNEKEFYQTETIKVNEEKKELFSSPKNLEKFARERYFMKKDDEDIYIFE